MRDPDELTQLEEERRFLLRSLTDLEREHEAGDVDEHDYAVLRNGYTARAAAVLREIERESVPAAESRRTAWPKVAAWVVAVVAVAVGAGLLVARASGQRLAGQTITGGQTLDEVPSKLATARIMYGSGDFAGAIALYQEVLEVEPESSEARTYIAWLLALNARGASEETRTLALDQAAANFRRVIENDPEYADAHCLYAVMAAQLVAEPDLELAKEEGTRCLDANPPAEMRQLVEDFVARL